MGAIRLILACLATLVTPILHAAPPFGGTIFLDPDVITPSDTTTFTNIVYTGQGIRLMYDRRSNSFNNVNAFLFNASYNDALTIELQVNPEFTNSTMAAVDATKYATVIGRLPTYARSRVQTVWLHKGVNPFGGGNNNLLIHTGQAELYEADGILEETFVHESGHTSLDPTNAAAPGWLAAQAADMEFISTYARDNPTSEDIAESILPWVMVRYRSSRIDGSLSDTIVTTIPHRLAYFDQINLDLYPIVPSGPPSATGVQATGVKARTATLQATIDPSNRTTSVFFVYGPGGATLSTPARMMTNLQPYAVSAQVYRLIPGTNYAFHVVVSNKFGIYVGGNLAFITPGDSSKIDATVPGDFITATSTNSPGTQVAPNVIDNNGTSKYLNFDKLNAGFTVAPTGAGPIRGLTLISAEDAPERDPSSFVIDGSNDGVNFTRIASSAVPPFPSRHSIQSFPLPGTRQFNLYRVLFATVSNASSANSMQIAEVELLYYGEITSPNDPVSITLPGNAVDVRGVSALFDRQLDDIRKLEVAPISVESTVVDVIPAAGASVLKGFELIGAADDFTYPQRRPTHVAVAGSNDGTNYTPIATVVPLAPSFNLQAQEFPVTSNTNVWRRYRVTFGAPVSGDRLQVGEMRLFGEIVPALTLRASGPDVFLSWPYIPGYNLEMNTTLSSGSWNLVGNPPVLSTGTNTVTLPWGGTPSFFRLRK